VIGCRYRGLPRHHVSPRRGGSRDKKGVTSGIRKNAVRHTTNRGDGGVAEATLRTISWRHGSSRFRLQAWGHGKLSLVGVAREKLDRAEVPCRGDVQHVGKPMTSGNRMLG
jgi:hypothetical protein